jgi:hypothetical protein
VAAPGRDGQTGVQADSHFKAKMVSGFELVSLSLERLLNPQSLIMRNLRKKRRENVGWGYTNQTAEGKRR